MELSPRDLGHDAQPKILRKWIVVILVTCIPVTIFLILLLLRRQIYWLWLRIRRRSISTPASKNTKNFDIETDPGYEQHVKADDSFNRNTTNPFRVGSTAV
ncbi:hypothetical protein TWF696_009152 [Orbilia brochopaga]|uniref:Uncharacterized protein n=1 Tax=Orbilia brochopaga TaxID=3140254 RepID=A0AAV9UHV9_9PEZI